MGSLCQWDAACADAVAVGSRHRTTPTLPAAVTRAGRRQALGDTERQMTVLHGLRLAAAAIVLGGLAVWLTANLSNELKTGVARARGGVRIAKRKRPTMFWLTLTAQALFLACALYGLSRLVPEVLK